VVCADSAPSRNHPTAGFRIITQLVNRSAIADWRAIKILLDLVRDIEGQTEPASSETSAFSEADEKVIEQLKMRFSKGEK
jgi:hypothetical protein